MCIRDRFWAACRLPSFEFIKYCITTPPFYFLLYHIYHKYKSIFYFTYSALITAWFEKRKSEKLFAKALFEAFFHITAVWITEGSSGSIVHPAFSQIILFCFVEMIRQRYVSSFAEALFSIKQKSMRFLFSLSYISSVFPNRKWSWQFGFPF